jgi:hypothetical protein
VDTPWVCRRPRMVDGGRIMMWQIPHIISDRPYDPAHTTIPRVDGNSVAPKYEFVL